MIIIDSDNYAEHGIETMFFPGGEPHCKVPREILNKKQAVLLFLKLRTWNDVGIAACILDAMAKRSGLIIPFIPYFPGARQDKVKAEDPALYPWTIGIVGSLLTCMYGEVVVFDPHSHVLSEIAGLFEVNITDLEVPIKEDIVGIIVPDQGAKGRAMNFASHFYPKAELIQFYKKRDAHTGGLEIDKEKLPAIKQTGRYIIVDDICDGGGTFNLLAEQFFQISPQGCSLELIVSHGIFSKGLGAIDTRIEHITTTDSWFNPKEYRLDWSPNRLTALSLHKLFPKIKEHFGA